MSVHDPQRAFSVLEMNVRGQTLEECGRKYGISASRCGQLILVGLHLLRELPPVRADDTRPNWREACRYWDVEERQREGNLLLGLIETARRLPEFRLETRKLGPTPRWSIAKKVGERHGISARLVLNVIREYRRIEIKFARSPTEQTSVAKPRVQQRRSRRRSNANPRE